MKAIIFGSSGQDGVYLTELLKNKGIDVVGISRSEKQFVDLSQFTSVKALMADLKPEYVFHLAAISATSHGYIFENFSTIVNGSLNLLEAIKLVSPKTKLFLSGSGLQFKNEGKPINENAVLDAGSAYSMARIQSLYAARYYRSYGLKVYFGSFFNHDSPLREEKHVSKMISSAVKRIRSGSSETITIGNYDVKKEWGFAGDIVKGVWTFISQDEVFETVIGTGEAYSIKEWLKLCFDLIGKNWEDYVRVSNSFVPEYDTLVSDPRTLFALGWKPEVTFDQLAKMMVSDAKI